MNRQERRDRRLARAEQLRDTALASDGLEHTEHRLKNRADVAAKLRALGYEGRVIRGRGWWELWQGGGAPVGSAEHVDGVLHVYAPPPTNSTEPPEPPPRKADPRYRRVTVSRSVWAWDRHLAALGVTRRPGEGVNEALHRADKQLDRRLRKGFRGLVK